MNKIILNTIKDEIDWKIIKQFGPKAIIATHKAIKIDPILKLKPVNLWKIESAADKTFL